MKQRVAVSVLIVAVWTSMLATESHAAKILLVPMNANSHVMYFSRLGIGLAKLGHVTTLLAPSNARVPDFVHDDMKNSTYIQYPVDRETQFVNSPEMARMMLTSAMKKSTLQYMRSVRECHAHVRRSSEEDCTQLLDNVEVMRKVRESEYDFAIMDPVSAIACYYIIPLTLRIPYASLSIPLLFTADSFRVPRLVSFPNFINPNEPPTFFERLQTFIIEIADDFFYTDSTHFMNKYAPDHPLVSTMEMMQRQSLWFFLEDLSTNHPSPQMPNTVAIGDIMAGERGQPLSAEIEEFVSNSKHGVIIVAFSSLFSPKLFPPAITRPLCEALIEATKQFGLSVIWTLNDKDFCRNDNILMSPWLSQNDLLADSRVKLFINHGGYNSVIESVYHAKPLIIFPIGLDQRGNAATAESKGYAIRMNIADFSSESLVSNIGNLITDPRYKRNAQLASDILRDRRDTPAERVSAMIDHVIKYGDRHIRTGAFQLSTLQFIMFDIFAALVAAAAVSLLCVIVCCYCVYLKCCRQRCHNKSSREKYKLQ